MDCPNWELHTPTTTKRWIVIGSFFAAAVVAIGTFMYGAGELLQGLAAISSEIRNWIIFLIEHTQWLLRIAVTVPITWRIMSEIRRANALP